MNAIERLVEYTTVPNEPTDQFIESSSIDKDWPSKGEIKFENFQLRYRPETDLVLKGLNIHIKPKEKIGVVGRTVRNIFVLI